MGLVLASRRESEGNPQKTVTFGVADRSYRMNAGHKKPATTQENTVTTITTRRSTATKLFSAAAWMLVLPAVALGFAGPAKAGRTKRLRAVFTMHLLRHMTHTHRRKNAAADSADT